MNKPTTLAEMSLSDLIDQSLRIQRQIFREGSTPEADELLAAIDGEMRKRSEPELRRRDIAEAMCCIPDRIPLH